MGTSTIVVPRTYRSYPWKTGNSPRSYPQPAGLWLPETHFVPHKFPLEVVYPQPNAVVNSWARHLWFYYDTGSGATFDQVIPMGMRGGAYPYNWYIMEAPPGCSIGTQYVAGGVGYGDLVVHPTGAFTNALFWIRGIDQEGNYKDIMWTASTTSSTTYFIFANADTGSDTAAGTLSAPFQTLSHVYGATAGASTFPGATLVLRGATASYAAYDQGSGDGIALSGGANPVVVVAYANESPVIDLTNAGTINGFNLYSTASDTFLQGITFKNGPSAALQFHLLKNANQNDRITLHNLSAPDAYNGAGTTNENAGFVSFDDPGTDNYRQFIFFKGLSETNRTGGWGESLFGLYTNQHLLIEFCSSINCGTGGPVIKGSNADVTVRCHTQVMAASGSWPGGEWPINFFDQVQASSGLPNSNHEICYCILDTSASGYAYSQGFNNLGTEGCGPSYSYRNSYLGPPDVNGTATGNGPFQYESDAIQWGSPFSQAVYANKTAGALPAAVTNLNPECQAQSGIFTNPAGGDYSFQSAYSAFTGLRGAGIS